MNSSIPRSTDLEFINIQPINPLISRCEIKVLYSGANRNGSFISKDVANRMANSLPGIPIIGEYLLQIDDFKEHGEEEIVIDKNGIRFLKSTVPYGFVPTDAKVWWATFGDKDGVDREYLVTEGYLWTGMYPETKRVIDIGNHQSMELDPQRLKGQWSKIQGEWSKFENTEREYFIVSDATFSALCILGEDVEPCFEGANITRDSSLTYSLNTDDFKEKMFDLMSELTSALNQFSNKGGIPNVENIKTEGLENEKENKENPIDGGAPADSDFAKKKPDEEEDKKDSVDDEDKDPDDSDDTEDDEEKKKKKKFAKEEDDEEEKKKKDEKFAKEDDEEEKKKNCKASYSLEDVAEYQELLEKFNTLESKFSVIETELNTIKPVYNELKQKQIEAENLAKDNMINQFFMLSEEDKKDVITNKEKYSLDEIEAKLSVICVRNKVNFNLDDNAENKDNTEAPITTFGVNNSFDSTPAWIKAVERVRENKKRR